MTSREPQALPDQSAPDVFEPRLLLGNALHWSGGSAGAELAALGRPARTRRPANPGGDPSDGHVGLGT